MIPPDVGQECSDGPTACNPNTAYCDAASLTCQALKLNDSCTGADQCLSGSCTTNVCDVEYLYDGCL